MSGSVQPHNARPAAVWGMGGAAYDRISQQIATALEHCVQRLDARPTDHLLDVASGTGWMSRLLARRGAKVVGVDFAGELLAAARSDCARCWATRSIWRSSTAPASIMNVTAQRRGTRSSPATDLPRHWPTASIRHGAPIYSVTSWRSMTGSVLIWALPCRASMC